MWSIVSCPTIEKVFSLKFPPIIFISIFELFINSKAILIALVKTISFFLSCNILASSRVVVPPVI